MFNKIEKFSEIGNKKPRKMRGFFMTQQILFVFVF